MPKASPPKDPPDIRKRPELQLLRPFRRTYRDPVTYPKPRSLGRTAVEGELSAALGEVSVGELEARRELCRLRLDAEEAHAPDLWKAVFLPSIQDERRRKRIPRRG